MNNAYNNNAKIERTMGTMETHNYNVKNDILSAQMADKPKTMGCLPNNSRDTKHMSNTIL